MTEFRITRLEETLAYQANTIEELNEVVTKQQTEIDRLTRQVTMLMKRAAEQEADETSSSMPLADQLPPHW